MYDSSINHFCLNITRFVSGDVSPKKHSIPLIRVIEDGDPQEDMIN